MENFPYLKKILNTNNLRIILQSKELAQLGDFLANFIYSTKRYGIHGKSGSVHVWDYSLRVALEKADLRKILGQRTKPDKVADASEALIAYAYYTDLLTIEEMIEYIKIDDTKLNHRNDEKEHCAEVFSYLLLHIIKLSDDKKRFTNK